MKTKIREQYLIDEFVDFTGETREFVLCAITTEYTECDHTMKDFNVGLSVCNYCDVYNEEVGKKIAKQKAMTDPVECMTAWEAITFNTDTVNAILKSYAEYFKKDPGIFIRAYNSQKKDYEKNPDRFLAKREFYLNKAEQIKKLEKELKELKGSKFEYVVHKTR